MSRPGRSAVWIGSASRSCVEGNPALWVVHGELDLGDAVHSHGHRMRSGEACDELRSSGVASRFRAVLAEGLVREIRDDGPLTFAWIRTPIHPNERAVRDHQVSLRIGHDAGVLRFCEGLGPDLQVSGWARRCTGRTSFRACGTWALQAPISLLLPWVRGESFAADLAHRGPSTCPEASPACGGSSVARRARSKGAVTTAGHAARRLRRAVFEMRCRLSAEPRPLSRPWR